jgi:hypothetical protein
VVSDVPNEGSIERALNWRSQVDEHVRMQDGSKIQMVCVLVTSMSAADLKHCQSL